MLYIEVSGCLPRCGHGTIGVATVLVETGMVAVNEPVTEIRLDTPAGLVVAEVRVGDGRTESVTLRNVPSFAYALDALVDTTSLGPVRLDVAFGGNFYAIVDLAALGIPFTPDEAPVRQRMLDASLEIMDAVSAQLAPAHPEQPEIRGCHHVYLAAPGSTARASRHVMAIYPGRFDRSSCGTGTSARMAQLYARGELGLHEDFVNKSIIGSRFVGRVGWRDLGGRSAGRPADRDRTGMGHRHGAISAGSHRPLPRRFPAIAGVNCVRDQFDA